jgi:hypothetical protein
MKVDYMANKLKEIDLRGLEAIRLRRQVTQYQSWAVPSTAAVMFVRMHSPLVEIGAGGGLWARFITKAGGDIKSFDHKPVKKRGRNTYCKKQYFNVLLGGVEKVKKYPNRALFLCWPNYDTPMAYNALRKYRGDTLVYIGEGWGGCTGCDRFHGLVDAEWEEEERMKMPRFEIARDFAAVYRRKK